MQNEIYMFFYNLYHVSVHLSSQSQGIVPTSVEDILKELYVEPTWAESNRANCKELPRVEINTLDLQWLQVSHRTDRQDLPSL